MHTGDFSKLTNSPLSKYSTHHAQNPACTYVFLRDVCPGKRYTPHSGMIYPCEFFGKIKRVEVRNVGIRIDGKQYKIITLKAQCTCISGNYTVHVSGGR